ncbi:inositol polyphosphate 5-phosphatase INPP5E [Schistosoma bovis]|uniref:Inositol polyphosphate 5-phosphatase INPP5E n=2 Tax=Schistosoma bovis TaxID=6184 RepID=A0A430QE72_SCHBO|nr:inositol polyphosphate 5-phosphatase INPP5E [Schistosoma bovis]
MDRQESSSKPSSSLRTELDVPSADTCSTVSCGYNLRPSGSVSSIASSFTATKKDHPVSYVWGNSLRINLPQSVGVTTSAAVRTKGAVAICFILFGTSILFLSAHFKANHTNFERRVQDYLQVVNNINLPKVGFNKGYKYEESNPLDRFDVVFWAGDLNFRIQRPRHIVENIIKGKYKHRTFEELLSVDELLNAQSQGIIFQNFDEGRIRFPPTYKFDLNSDAYDSSEKQRVPSYTDRILFMSKKKDNLICLDYNSINTIRSSDHRPVFALFSLVLRPGSDNIALAAGAFNREIYIAGSEETTLPTDNKDVYETTGHPELLDCCDA